MWPFDSRRCSSKSCKISGIMLCITANQILKRYIFHSPPSRGDLNVFCDVLKEHDKRFSPNFLEDFSMLFNVLRGSLPIHNLPEHLLKIFKRMELNPKADRWNPKSDPHYLCDRRPVDDFSHSSSRSSQVIYCSFDQSRLTFPKRVSFLDDFLEIFNHLCGLYTTGKTEYLKIFEEVNWNPRDDPDYETPKSLMKDLFEDRVENLLADLEIVEVVTAAEIQEVVTAEEIEENKKSKRKLMDELAKKSTARNKKAYREGRLGRELDKKEAQLKIASNRFKNTVKKNQKK